MFEHILVEQIDPNPFQTRTRADAAALAALADDIQRNGLLQPPTGREHPAAPGRYQLAFGHRRLAAWKLAKPDEKFPLEVKPLTDREMSDLAASENAQRADLTAIEVAQAIEQRIEVFHLTPLEAGRPFGLTTDAGVSNKRSLLRLPAPVQLAVRDRGLPERVARQFRMVQRIAPKEVDRVLAGVLSADNSETVLNDALEELLDKKGRPLKGVPWDLKWPASPIPLQPPKGELAELVACVGCPQMVRRRHDEWEGPLCAGWDCYDEKMARRVPEQVAEIGKKLKIAPAAPAEKTIVVYDGAVGMYETGGYRVRALVDHPTPELRLVPWTKDDHRDYDREQVLGSAYVALATVDKAATDKALAKEASRGDGHFPGPSPRATKAAPPKGETESQKAARLEKEGKEQAARRTARSRFNKEKHDILWMMEHAAGLVAERIAVTPSPFLHFVEDALVHPVGGNHFGEMNAYMDRLEEEIESAKTHDQRDGSRRRLIAYSVIVKNVVHDTGFSKPEGIYRFGEARRLILEVCGGEDKIDPERFGVDLPKGWDQPPIHKTAYNCHECGAFAPGEKITGRDRAEGWTTEESQGEIIHVRCPACVRKHAVKKVDDQIRAMLKDGSLKRVRPKTKAGFTKPAPKPGGKRRGKRKVRS